MTPTSTDDPERHQPAAAQRPPKKRPEWRTFWLVERDEQGGGWTPLKQFTKRTARAAALTAAYKLGDGVAIHILDNYNKRISAFRSVHERIPEDKRTAVQRARSIDTVVKVYVDGLYKMTAQQAFCERDRRGRRPPNVAVVETSGAGANE